MLPPCAGMIQIRFDGRSVIASSQPGTPDSRVDLMIIAPGTTRYLRRVTVDDAPAQTRRARRAPQSTSQSTSAEVMATTTTTTTTTSNLTAAPAASAPSTHVALGWVQEGRVASAPPAAGDLGAVASPYRPVGADLLASPPRRSLLRAGVIVPTLVLAALAGTYAGGTLLWPLHAIPPEIQTAQVAPLPAAPATLTWPAEGSAAVAVAGIGGPVSSSAEPAQIASITKVMTALLVLEEMPLAVGESGPDFRFSASDSDEYWNYLLRDESAIDVPVDGTLSEYQMLQGMLIGSANNYADRLRQTIWPSDAVFAQAAADWLSAHGVDGLTIVEPTGLDDRNAGSPDALIALATLALANPVIAEIVATPAVEIPGAGLVTNTNQLLADPGIVGIKTGSLDSWTLLSAKDVVVGDTTVRIYASVLGQPDNDARIAASRQLYADVELGLQPAPSVPVGTVAGRVSTAWGEEVDVVTATDAAVILWNGGAGAVTTAFALNDALEAGADVGTLSVQGPLNAASTSLELATDIEPPTAWWRLTHPLELLGID